MINKDFGSILELIAAFPTEKSCIKHLESVIWATDPVSPFDASSKVYTYSNGRYKCKNTQKYFNVKTGTMFDNTKLPLQKWFLAIWLATSHKKGISSLQLGKDIGVTQKSSWFMLQRIRNCFGIDGHLDGEVEADEAYIGGSSKNKHASKKTGFYKDKTPVLGMVQRGGDVIAQKVGDTGVHDLTKGIQECVKNTAKIYTDEWRGYRILHRFYDHQTINHSHGKYVDGNVHTNTIEGFWSLLKRGIYGIYHFVSDKHLQKYVNEFAFRYNTRELTESQRFNKMLLNCDYRLTYSQLIA